MAYGPLKRLLSPHGKADDRLKLRNAQRFANQAILGLHVVANGNLREPRATKRIRRIAWRRRHSVRELVGQNQKVFCRIEFLSWADQIIVAGMVCAVVGRE